jgi:2-dehydro-3-deoxyglucarate aldolase/4-hydroxy-2-oxoheptanedioate aldolase
MVPRVETRAQAEEIVAQLKYAPSGRRGVALGVAHDLYRAGSAEFFNQANEETVVILLLETAKAFENLDEIISVPGVDIAWMGHYDLTVSMGIPAQFEHPLFLKAMDALVTSCRRYGVAPGFLPATPEGAVHWIRKGFRALSLGSDIGVLMNGVRNFRQSVIDSTPELAAAGEGVR